VPPGPAGGPDRGGDRVPQVGAVGRVPTVHGRPVVLVGDPDDAGDDAHSAVGRGAVGGILVDDLRPVAAVGVDLLPRGPHERLLRHVHHVPVLPGLGDDAPHRVAGGRVQEGEPPREVVAVPADAQDPGVHRRSSLPRPHRPPRRHREALRPHGPHDVHVEGADREAREQALAGPGVVDPDPEPGTLDPAIRGIGEHADHQERCPLGHRHPEQGGEALLLGLVAGGDQPLCDGREEVTAARVDDPQVMESAGGERVAARVHRGPGVSLQRALPGPAHDLHGHPQVGEVRLEIHRAQDHLETPLRRVIGHPDQGVGDPAGRLRRQEAPRSPGGALLGRRRARGGEEDREQDGHEQGRTERKSGRGSRGHVGSLRRVCASPGGRARSRAASPAGNRIKSKIGEAGGPGQPGAGGRRRLSTEIS